MFLEPVIERIKVGKQGIGSTPTPRIGAPSIYIAEVRRKAERQIDGIGQADARFGTDAGSGVQFSTIHRGTGRVPMAFDFRTWLR